MRRVSKHRMRGTRAIVLVIGAAWGATLDAQEAGPAQVVWVSVREAVTLQPISGARVRVLARPGASEGSDSTGGVALALMGPHEQLVATRLGFRPETTLVGPEAWAAGVVTIELRPLAPTLDPVRVIGESSVVSPMMREFDERRSRRGGGASFIGPEDLARQSSSRVTDFLRRGILGVTLVDSGGVLLPVSSRGEIVRVNQGRARGPGRAPVERVYCVLRVAVDGVPMEWGFDLKALDPKDLHGIEVYAGPATIPAQYQSMGRDGYCGLILIWTRSR